jgi:hypothetical protein
MSDEGMVPYGTEGLHLPTRYDVEIDDPECPILLEIHVAVVDGQPRCAELRCRPRPGGPPVSSENLRRVPLARYVRESAALYSMRVVVYDAGQVLVSSTGTGDEPLLARAAQQRPRQHMTDDLLRDVARVYSEAGTKPTLAVMRRFYLSRPTAGRWVVLARKRGFLPELPPRARKR